MQINYDNTQSFGSVKISSKTRDIIYKRFGYMPEQNYILSKMIDSQKTNPVDAEITTIGKHNRLVCKYKSRNFSGLPEEKENVISAFLNFSPMRFLKRVFKKAEMLGNDEKDIAEFHSKHPMQYIETEDWIG